MLGLFDRFREGDEPECSCDPVLDGRTLSVDARACDGRLAEAPACRGTVVGALAARDADRIRVRDVGLERIYDGRAAALLSAAGRFADLARPHDLAIAERALRDPLGAARAAGARASRIGELAAETGLAEVATGLEGYEDALRPAVAPAMADAHVVVRPPSEARLVASRTTDTEATVRIYERSDEGTAAYHVEPVDVGLDPGSLATLEEACDRLVGDGTASFPGGNEERSGRSSDGIDGISPATAVREVAGEDDPIGTLIAVLEKHTRGYGILEDLFADPCVSDVYASGPASEGPLWVVADGEPMRTNVYPSAAGVEAIASRLRRESGRSFSRASPTLDATADLDAGRIRVAGVSEPATDGLAFAFRDGGEEAFTLPGLVANGTLPTNAAGLLSTAVRRDAAALVAGARGAGKTTTLGALLWELPATTRTVVVEDTPELPVGTLREHGRDVQPIRTTLGDGPGISPIEALRTALRLGESAIVLGEVRGEEAAVLYEAMRVGASGSAVLGTIHGDGGADVRERVVADLGVAPSSFAATDLVVTLESYVDDGAKRRRAKAIEEVVGGDGVRFEPLYALEDGTLVPTGRLRRGNSRLVERLARSEESYADVLDRIERRAELLGTLAERGETAPEVVTTAYARRANRPC